MKRKANVAIEFLKNKLDWLDQELNPRPLENEVAELETTIIRGSKTILYVAPRFDYGSEARGLSFEHHNFYQTWKNMGFGIIYFDYDRIYKKHGGKLTSAMLREACYYYAPDYLFYSHYHDWIDHDTWFDLSNNLPTKTIIWLSDDHWRYEETASLWRQFNLVVTTDKGGYQKRVSSGFDQVHLTQWACNHYVYHNFQMNRDIDVSFIGQSYGDRKDFIQKLREGGIDVHAFGPGWDGSGRVSQSEMISLLNRSKIVLDLPKASKGKDLQIKGRVFEATGVGALLLTQRTPNLNEYFRLDDEIVIYEDIEDCVTKIKELLNNDPMRARIAEAGSRRVMADHTFEKRFRDLLAAADDSKRV